MTLINFIGFYWLWHYTDGAQAYIRNYLNVAKFFYNYFSIGYILKTFFSSVWISNFSFSKNTILKPFIYILGILVKIFILILGFITISLHTIGGIILFALWFFIPFILIIFYIYGFLYIFRVFI